MNNCSKIVLTDLAALLLGISLTFAFAPVQFFPLAILAPAGLLTLWLNKTPKQAFYLGWLFGLGFFGTGLYWVFHSIHNIGEVPTWLALIITGGLIAFMGFYIAIVGFFTNRFFPQQSSSKLLFAFPAIWVLSEWIRSWFLTGFPWLLLGYSQTQSPLRGYAPVLGVYGISLVTLILSGLLVNIFCHYQNKLYRPILKNALTFCALLVFGSLLALIPWTSPKGPMVPVSLVQGNIKQSIKWSPKFLALSLQRYRDLTLPLLKKDQLIIWPESAIPLPVQTDRSFEYITDLNARVKAKDAKLIFGIPYQASNQEGFYNAILALGNIDTSSGNYTTVYTKRRLVPFGEYVPFSKWISDVLNFMRIPALEGTVEGPIYQDPLTVGDLRILPAICYEIAFPELMRQLDKNIDFLLTVTNDAWFGDSSAEAQHIQMAEMRALEYKRPLLFVSNDGITAIINANGQMTASLPQRTIGVLNGSIQPRNGLTPWLQNGMSPILFLLICFLFISFRQQRMLKKQPTIIKQPASSHAALFSKAATEDMNGHTN